ncbi:hypothetical protein HCU01_19180 [Halomonas cupida]|uniref:Uncharacterized protein n=1 Tax=Halomonas cupida TaxID=44933 RepID=A0A1M7I0Q6_9GAMM|nr:hypothetical protein [Halomonas cupida]GEN23969.1 hypothetical protein HCU01_19180 [Halomonas cupida]SHM34153.1 hypothetical protein SAMN05660971_02756 [Halomonas cupida]
MVAESTGKTETNQAPTTVPEQFAITARGALPSEDEARMLATLIGQVVRQFSRVFDLSQLDGVTVAEDYAQALAELDRGYESNHPLTPSEGAVVGVAMTPSVLRDGMLKSHIVVNAQYLWPLLDDTHPDFQSALHIVAHECAHVEITGKFEAAIPGVLLRKRFTDIRDRARSDVIIACWDEYAATLLSAGFGEDPTEAYEATLITHMGTARQEANESIKAYRLHSGVEKVYCEVYRAYGNLLKYAAYYLGNLAGHGLELSQRPNFEATLAGHWFEAYFHRLDEACYTIAAQYGTWQDHGVFEVIGDIADDMVAEGGILCTSLQDGGLYLDIPYMPETVP